MAELNVSRKTIGKLLSDMTDQIFIIPEYQRPYTWDIEKCETLWNDITNFFFDRKESEEYFLGTIVTCKAEGNPKEIEIIDGQQRVTSLMLLLRAFYSKLQAMNEDENIVGLKRQVEPCIWDVDQISGKVKDFSKLHISSRVVTESDNDAFHAILKTGHTPTGATDKYSQNYRFFFAQCEQFAKDHPTRWQPLLVTILRYCIVLPIECETADTALIIFSTLNDRGEPLSDADIFKAQIYRAQSTTELKNQFTRQWKELSETANDGGIDVNDLFRYYTHVIRAKSGDKSREMGLRKFYALDNYARLKEAELMPNLLKLGDQWLALNNLTESNDENGVFDFEILKFVHCLHNYPNEYWKYATTVFLFKNAGSPTFSTDFLAFLKRLTAYLFVMFVRHPSVNAIKDTIFQACIELWSSGKANNALSTSPDIAKDIGKTSTWKIARPLILLHAYLNPKQTKLIPTKFEIEHIFPRIWQNTNYNGWTRQDADEYLESFGNKVVIEKKINIQAGNGYFGQKKSKYLKSKIANVLDLAAVPQLDWQKTDIEQREAEFTKTLSKFFAEALA